MNRKLSILLVSILLVLLSDVACSLPTNEPSKSSRMAFNDFTKSYVALDYPTKDELKQCLSKDSCKALYLRAMRSLGTLFAQGRDKAFKDTLWIIENQCPLGRKGEHQCSAAVGLLYFFNNKTEDEKLLSFAKKASPTIIESLFYSGIDWLVDRPYEQKWVAFIDSSDDIGLERKGGLRGWIASPPENSRIKNIYAQFENWKRSNFKSE